MNKKLLFVSVLVIGLFQLPSCGSGASDKVPDDCPKVLRDLESATAEYLAMVERAEKGEANGSQVFDAGMKHSELAFECAKLDLEGECREHFHRLSRQYRESVEKQNKNKE